MIYIWDIDGTICEESNRWWEYEKAKPIQSAINRINELFGQDNLIILHTARFEQDREVTERWLDKHKVRYHKLIMGKPRGDIYVDNSSRRVEEL